jgi:hypothetical protein
MRSESGGPLDAPRYSSLNPDRFVFRVAEPDSRFLPRGHSRPDMAILDLSSEDKAEALRSGRRPGLSVWDATQTPLADAQRLTKKWEGLAFGARVANLRAVGQAFERPLDVVTDPRPASDGPGAAGHALVEGLDRPKMTERQRQKDFLFAVLSLLEPHP